MAFDPDKYLTEKKAEFNPDSYLASKTSPQEAPGYVETAARGLGQAAFGLGDELEGAVKASLSQNDTKNWLDRYRDERDKARQANALAAQTNPKTFYSSELGGGLATSLIPGALGLKGLQGLAAVGALTGLGSSNSDLTKGDVIPAAVSSGAGALGGAAFHYFPKTTGTTIGGLLGGSMAKQDLREGNYGTAGAKLLAGLAGGRLLGGLAAKNPVVAEEGVPAELQGTTEAIEQSPLKAQISEAFKSGKAGEGFNKSKNVLSREAAKEQDAISGIKGVFDEAEGKLLSEKKALLESAQNVLQPEPEKVSQIPSFLDFASKSGEVSKRDLQEVAQVLDQYAQGGLSPKVADMARRKLQQMASSIQDPNVRGSISGVADELESGIEKAIPGYGEANSNIHQFLKSGRETLLSRGKNPEVSKLQIGGLHKEDLKTEQELSRILGSLRNYKQGATQESQGAVDKTMQSLSNLFEENPDLAKKVGINLPGLEKQIYTAADQNAVANKLLPGTFGDLKPGNSILGVPIPAEKGILKGANLIGQAIKKSSDLYRLPKEGLMDTATKLQNSGVPGLSSVGEGLSKALESGDQHKTNATLFTILQNPSARKFLGYSPENESKPGDNFGQ